MKQPTLMANEVTGPYLYCSVGSSVDGAWMQMRLIRWPCRGGRGRGVDAADQVDLQV